MKPQGIIARIYFLLSQWEAGDRLASDRSDAGRTAYLIAGRVYLQGIWVAYSASDILDPSQADRALRLEYDSWRPQ